MAWRWSLEVPPPQESGASCVPISNKLSKKSTHKLTICKTIDYRRNRRLGAPPDTPTGRRTIKRIASRHQDNP